MKLSSIPAQHYQDYRTDVMFDGYKWDLQAGEQSTISDRVLLMEPDEAEYLSQTAVAMFHETVAMEQALRTRPDLAVELGISQQMVDALCSCVYDPTKHMRYMRFDFHPTVEGWRVSEVNSDVPAGYPEASVLPVLAQRYFPEYKQFGCFGEKFHEKISRLVPAGSTIAYLHDTHTVEDYQILHYIGDLMEQNGYKSLYAGPDFVKWENNRAVGIDGFIRHFPTEWLEFAKNVDWRGFLNSQTTSCNHPAALFTQSKRLPVVWDRLSLEIPIWKKLLPDTKCASMYVPDSGWILKPAFGRVGEGINIPGTLDAQEEEEIVKAARENPTQWVTQKMFESAPLDNMHLSVGVFVIDGEFGGFFSRISSEPKMNEDASEIPILVKGENK